MADFLTDKNSTGASPIILVEYDFPIFIPEYINYEAGIWQSFITPGVITVTDDHDVTGHYRNTNTVRYNIQSFCVNSEFFLKVTSFASLRAQNKSFYYDKETTRVWFHFNEWEYPPLDSYRIALGSVEGYSNKVDPLREDGAFYEYTYYEPRVLGIPNASRAKDPLTFGILSFDGGTVSFVNADGFFDEFVDRKMFGQPVRILMGFEGYEYDDFRKIFSGYIQDFSYDWEEFKLNVKDARKKLSNKLPVRKLAIEEFPFLNEKNIDKYIPIAYGENFNAPTYCVNEDDSTGPYLFYFMDTEFYPAVSVDTVYVEGSEVVPDSVELAEGYFALTEGQCKPEGTMTEVTVDFHGAAITKGIEVIKNLFLRYADMVFILENFNLDEFSQAAVFDKDVGLFVKDRTDFIDVVQSVSVAIDGFFFPQDDGLFTIRIFNNQRTVKKIIFSDDWVSEPDISYNSEQYLSSVEIKFAQDINKSEFKSLINIDYEADAYRDYKTYNETSIECILTTREDAQQKSIQIMERSKDIPEQVTRKTRVQHFDLDIMDFVVCEHSRLDIAVKPWKIYEIQKINKKIDSNEIELTMNEIKSYDMSILDYIFIPGVLFMQWMFNSRLFGTAEYRSV